MRYEVRLEGFEGQLVEVEPRLGGLWGGPRLFVNDQQVPGNKKMQLRRNDGREVTVRWKNDLWGVDVPNLDVDGTIIQVAKPMPIGYKIWCLLPILLVFIGGALGGIIGAVGVLANGAIFRKRSIQPAVKVMIAIAVAIAAFVVYFLIASSIYSLLSGTSG